MLKRSIPALFLLILIAPGAASVRAQVVPAATRGQFGLTVGGLASAFQPDYAGGVDVLGHPIAQTSPNRLYGIGAFVDVKFRRWFQVEAEGRWLRFNQFVNISQDNYLIGPRVPLHTFHFMRATPYGKVLVGLGRMNFQYNEALGHFTAIAYGGGVDFKLTNRISARGDFEYQQWPNWLTSSLYPYGVSAGVSYRILGGYRGLPRLTAKEKRE
jgi:opacity protein-like surface antigen